MNDFFLLWLSLSLSGALVAVTLMLLKPLLRRFSKTWQYYLWLLAVLRLLIPFSPEISMVGSLFLQVQTHLTVQSQPMEAMPVSPLLDDTQSPTIPNSDATNPQEMPSAIAPFSIMQKHGWGALWFGIALLLLVRKIVGYERFLKMIKKDGRIIADGQVPVTLQTVCTAMGIRRKISVSIHPFVRAPMLVGFMHPIILLPCEDIPSSELALIFRHELTHARRMDFLYKWLTEIAVCLHWFNPFAYWVRKRISQDCEFSCDETVVACLAADERRTYGETLLNAIVINGSSGNDSLSLSLNKDGKLIKERLNAIMRYHQKPKWIVLIATVLTSVLLCGTVFAGTYTVTAMENTQSELNISPIRIADKEIAPGGKIALGSQHLVSGTECPVTFTWTGSGKLTVVCTSSSDTIESLSLENGKANAFRIDVSGEYTIAIKNDTQSTIGNVNGTIAFQRNTLSLQSPSSDLSSNSSTSHTQTVTYKNVEMRCYEGADGHPYIHDTKENGTTQKIVGYQHGMLAFDKDGNPLKVNWWSLDTEVENTYFYLDETSSEIAPADTRDVRGGWSLNFYGTDSAVEEIAYVLYCDKEITFADGTVWTNPDFDNWRSIYEGKKVDVTVLKNYYPYKQKISFHTPS